MSAALTDRPPAAQENLQSAPKWSRSLGSIPTLMRPRVIVQGVRSTASRRFGVRRTADSSMQQTSLAKRLWRLVECLGWPLLERPVPAGGCRSARRTRRGRARGDGVRGCAASPGTRFGQALGSDGTNPAFGIGVCLSADRAAQDLGCHGPKMLSNAAVHLVSRSRRRKSTGELSAR